MAASLGWLPLNVATFRIEDVIDVKESIILIGLEVFAS